MRKNIKPSFAELTIANMIPADDPLKIIFDSIDFSFIYELCKNKYSQCGRQGFNPQSLFKALLLIYLGYASSERELARKLMLTLSALPQENASHFEGRLCYLCELSYGNTPKHNTFHYFRMRLGEREHFLSLLV